MYDSQLWLKEIEDYYSSPIIIEFSNYKIMNEESLVISVADFILIGPIYLSFTEDAFNQLDGSNYLNFDVYRTNNYIPNPVIEERLCNFYTEDFYFFSGYQAEKLRANNLIAMEYSFSAKAALLNGQPIEIQNQIKIESSVFGTPLYEGSVKVFIYQYDRNIIPITPY